MSKQEERPFLHIAKVLNLYVYLYLSKWNVGEQMKRETFLPSAISDLKLSLSIRQVLRNEPQTRIITVKLA